jgi:hypothetical protein
VSEAVSAAANVAPMISQTIRSSWSAVADGNVPQRGQSGVNVRFGQSMIAVHFALHGMTKEGDGMCWRLV